MDNIIPKNRVAALDEIWVYVNVDENGRENICAGFFPGSGWMPLVAGSQEHAERLRPVAVELAQQTGKRISLIKFIGREVVGIINGGN